MRTNTKYLFRFFLFFLLNIFSIQIIPQELNIEENTFYYPHSFGIKQLTHVVGLAQATLPEDVVETDDIFRAPLFTYDIKYGIPENFIFNGGIATNIVTFHFSAGINWNYNLGRLGLSAGTDIAYWFGRLKQFGFNTSYTGWILYPNISVGYRFNKFSLTLKSEVVFDIAEASKNGNIEVSNENEFYNGLTFGIYLEQPLWKDNYIVLGIRSTFLKFYYPMWAAFSTFDRRYYIPEAVFRFIL